MVRELQGKTALVTGATKGIGRAAALRLGADGAAVVAVGRSQADGESLVGEITAGGGNAIFVQADVASGADWTRVADETVRAFGRCDIVVASAGVSRPAPIRDMPLAQYHDLNAINLKGCFFALQTGANLIRAHGEGGSIVLVASIVGKIGVAGHTNYAASKDGVRLMTKAAALELGPEKIRVNSLHPGMIRTDMTAGFPEKAIAPSIPLGRFGLPEEMASAISFLAGPRSAFMTGAELVADGGWIAQ
jgi:NAD(P)-dependent dehydrogenase (short-subunit alcohol dehydrogenase family)